ncbi:MAG: RAD55 family ATPase, partial [Vicinamibacteria bacterium]
MERAALAEAGGGRRPDFPGLPASWRTPADVLLARPAAGRRLETGIAAIDKACRGGFQIPRLVTLQGPPSVGKTTLAMQIAERLASVDNAIVVALLPDEGPEAAGVRFGQNMGFHREKLEDGDSDELVAFDAKTCRMPVWFPDPDELPENTLEAVMERTAKFAGWYADRPAVLVVDSTQTAVLGAEEPDDVRKRIEAIMSALRVWTRTTPGLVINVA